MTAIHEFKCNGTGCKVRATAHYNGEHFLPPPGWLELQDPKMVELVGHLCVKCAPNLKDLEKAKAEHGPKRV